MVEEKGFVVNMRKRQPERHPEESRLNQAMRWVGKRRERGASRGQRQAKEPRAEDQESAYQKWQGERKPWEGKGNLVSGEVQGRQWVRGDRRSYRY